MTPEQEAIIRREWARGVRDPATLYATAGVTQQPTQQPVPAAAPPLPPPGDSFVEQGGLMGAAARAPIIGGMLQGLGAAYEHVLDPAATGLITIAQKALIPGEQMLERVSDEAYQAALDAGINPLKAGYMAAKAAGSGQFEQPVTTGLGINLPGEGIGLPSWLAGPGKRIDEIDIGRLAAELPFEIIAGKGAGLVTRPARAAAAARLAAAGHVGTAGKILPEGVPSTIDGAPGARIKYRPGTPDQPGIAEEIRQVPTVPWKPAPDEPFRYAKAEPFSEAIARNIDAVEEGYNDKIIRRNVDRFNRDWAETQKEIPSITKRVTRYTEAKKKKALGFVAQLQKDIFGVLTPAGQIGTYRALTSRAADSLNKDTVLSESARRIKEVYDAEFAARSIKQQAATDELARANKALNDAIEVAEEAGLARPERGADFITTGESIYNPGWRTAGTKGRNAGKPVATSIARGNSKAAIELKALAKRQLKAEKDWDTAEKRMLSILGKTRDGADLPTVQHAHKLKRHLEARRKVAANASKGGGGLYGYKDAARRALTKRYSDEGGGITGYDVLAIAVQTGRIPVATKNLLRSLANNLDSAGAGREVKRPGVETVQLRKEVERLSPLQDEIIKPIDEQVAAEVSRRLSERMEISRALRAAENKALTNYRDARSNPQFGQRSPDPVDGIEHTTPNKSAPVEAAEAAAHEPVPTQTRKYLTRPLIPLAEAAERLLNAGPFQAMKKLSDWLHDQRISSAPGFFNEGGWSLSALGTTGGRTVAWALENTVGLVKPTLLKQNLVFRAFVAFAVRMQAIPNAKLQDVDAFFVKALGIENTPGALQAKLLEVFPVEQSFDNPRAGLWGDTNYQAWDLIEAYWAHVDFLKNPSTYAARVQNYLSSRTDMRGFFRDPKKAQTRRTVSGAPIQTKGGVLRSPEEVSRAFDDVIGVESRSFLDELKIFNEEIRTSWRDSLTPEEALKFDKAVSTGLDTALPRQLLMKLDGEGKPFLVNQSATLSTAYKRAYDEIVESVNAGNVYDFNITNLLRRIATSSAQVEAAAELRKILVDGGVIIPSGLSGSSGIAAQVFRFFLEGEGKGILSKTDVDKLLKLQVKREGAIAALKKVEDAWPDKSARGYDDAINAATATASRTLLDIDGAIRKQILDPDSGFSIPSKQWAANNKDSYLTTTELLRAFGINSDAVTRIAGKAGLSGTYAIQESVKRDLRDSFRLVESIVYDMGAGSQLRPNWVTGKISTVADFWRLTSTGFDFAFPFTVGLPLLFINPAAWRRVSWDSTRAWWNRDVIKEVLNRDPSLVETIREMANAGIPLGDMEVYRFIAKKADGAYELDVDSFLKSFQETPSPTGLERGVTRGAGVFRRTLNNFQRSYNTGAMMNRVNWYRIKKPQYTRPDGSIDYIGLKDDVSNVTASLNITGMGRSVTAKQIENLFVGLSPRLTRSIATMVLDAQRAAFLILGSSNRKDMFTFALTQGKHGKRPLQILQDQVGDKALTPDQLSRAALQTRQLLALGNLGTTLSVTMATFYGLSYLKSRTEGKSHAEAEKIASVAMDPLSGKKFLATNIGGSWVGIGGFWRSLASLNWQLLGGTAQAVQGNFKPLEKFKRLDRFDNPLIATYMNRGAPALEFGGKFIEAVSGSLGAVPIDAAPYDVLDNISDLPLKGGASFLPFAVQGLFEGEGKEAFLFGVAGARTGQMTPSDMVVETARRGFNVDIDSSRDLSESWLKRDVLYPYVDAQYGLNSRASNSAFGLYTERRAELEADFFDRMKREYEAGGKDYDLLSFYYDERKLLNERMNEFEKVVGVSDFDINDKDPIAVALKAWRDIYDSPEVISALKGERWDLIEARRADLMKGFTTEQQEAVLRSGSGIPIQLLALLKPESQARYFDLYNKRKSWIMQNAKTPAMADQYVNGELGLKANMFPDLEVQRGITPESVGRSVGQSARDPQRSPVL